MIRLILTSLFIGTTFLVKSQNLPIVNGHQLEERLLYIENNFLLENEQGEILNLLQRAADNCFTGVVLSDPKLSLLNVLKDNEIFKNNINTFLDRAKTLDLTVYPAMSDFGYSVSILTQDPNLAEGLPVNNAPFIVQRVNNELILVNDPSDQVTILNADFETPPTIRNNLPDWPGQDAPGRVIFWDNTTVHSGNGSVRVSNAQLNPGGIARISQTFDVTPFRDYYVSVWVKTLFFSADEARIFIQNSTNRRVLHHNLIPTQRTKNWTKYEFTFNTLDSEKVDLFLGVWGGKSGTLWWDDLEIRPTTFNNIVRRAGTPVTITKSNGDVLREGVDTDSIIDPLLGVDPNLGAYSIWHEQPKIKIPATSSLAEGDKVNISYYHTSIIGGEQFSAALTVPKSLEIVSNQMQWIRDLMRAKGIFQGWFLGHDEIRMNNWDESPSFGSPGANLAYNMTQVYNRAKGIDSNAKLMVWSDMFDKFHNASSEVTPYYLVNGSWEGSWEGLPADVNIFNWQYSDRINSAEFFADRGHQQIICGYYDQSEFYTKDWLADISYLDGIKGVMYTTFNKDYTQLENWAQYIWGDCTNAEPAPNPTSTNQDTDCTTVDIRKNNDLSITLANLPASAKVEIANGPSWVPRLLCEGNCSQVEVVDNLTEQNYLFTIQSFSPYCYQQYTVNLAEENQETPDEEEMSLPLTDCNGITITNQLNEIILTNVPLNVKIERASAATSWTPILVCENNCSPTTVIENLGQTNQLLTFQTFNPYCYRQEWVVNSSNSRSHQLNLIAYELQREIDLQWSTNWANRTAYFIVEKSTDGKNFIPLERINNLDYKSEVKVFTSADAAPTIGVNYYRIKQYFVDNTFDYSTTKMIDYRKSYDQLEVFPNPLQNEFFISFKDWKTAGIQLKIVNQFGQVVKAMTINATHDSLVRVAVENLASGLYFLTIQPQKGGKPINRKLIVSKL